MLQLTQQTLKNWSFRQAGDEDWKPSRKGAETTEIHPDLIENGLIPDPFLDDNEKLVQWVGLKDWEYKVSFTPEASVSKLKVHELVFEGLDTFADVFLNGRKIISTDNMFVHYKADVGKYIKFGEENELRIYFYSAIVKGRELEKKFGWHGCSNGETSRTHVRKAQYHYGWDWGPLLMTCGPYRPIKFVSYDLSIDEVFVDVGITDELNASIDVKTTICGFAADAALQINVLSPSGETVASEKGQELKIGENSTKLYLESPQLWFPHTHGTPALYDFELTIVVDGHVIHSVTKKVGLRSVELIQEPFADQPGASFYFRVNGVPVYSNGSNWIPAHSFQTCLTPKDYTEWLELMVNGNQNMVRIWGGGYFEQDIFYQECDRLGLLVWHDMMFACAQYPGYKEFEESVEKEVICQLKRLRNYCSIALYCGNNEDYQSADRFKLTDETFFGKKRYEKSFPKLVSQYSPAVPYHPGSPWGGSSYKDETAGDIHQWNVWHGTQEKYQDWDKLGGRFVSEFGMEGAPALKTYEECITDPKYRYPQSYMIDHHNKSDVFERRLASYVTENVKMTGSDLDSWIYATQLMQAECLAYAYRCWRREWRGDGKRYSAGALVWQINDCWPCASWAIADFKKRPKLAYYSIKKESAPIVVGFYRTGIKKENGASNSNAKYSIPFNYNTTQYFLDIWGVNGTTSDIKAVFKVDLYHVTTGEKLKSLEDQKVILKANQSTEIFKQYELDTEIPIVAHGTFYDEEGSVLAAGADWPQPLKYLFFPDRKIEKVVKDGSITLSTNKPVKGVEIITENDIYLDDNGKYC
ncbi:glycosyl hydrolase family 2 protein [Yamadazyma tenuis]|uniref:glycosyl hydrolase family 2 protein n=1 Tax=Candida tenuis TaxID=2315449 RepID=UPI002798BB0D|nr:glycosyl hydrolase family 2 protein [Yamadazyma tenuis]